jgi:uncharacterized protein YkwD
MGSIRFSRDSHKVRIKRHVLVAFASGSFLFAGVQGAAAAGLTSAEAGLLSAVNSTRAAYGLRPVRYDATLERAARAHSADMLRNRYFAHGAFAQRMRRFGARGPFVGENLAWGAGSYAAAQTVIREWLASPAHRANLLRPGFERIGIGTVGGTFRGYAGAVVITADFGGR